MSRNSRRGEKKTARNIKNGLEWKLKVAEYREYLHSPQWQVFRMNIFASRGAKCERCPNTRSLQIHHKTYARIFNELPEDVEILCRSCHEKHHGRTPKPKPANPQVWQARRLRAQKRKAERKRIKLAKAMRKAERAKKAEEHVK